MLTLETTANFNLLHEQKGVLLEIIRQYESGAGPMPPPDKKYAEALTGILHFIDVFQALAVDQRLWAFPEQAEAPQTCNARHN